MKFLNIFKNKLFVSLLTVAVSVIVIVTSGLSIILPSYYKWKEYYEAAIKEREYQKYLQTLPLELVGISAKLSDAVTYYANGKAIPVNDDFIVTAHFTEKGKDFDRILTSNEFDIDYPENFAQEGGIVEVSYTFVPEATDEDENPEPVVKTAEVECELIKVVPVSLELTQMPYRIYYSDQMTFDTEGMKARVIFNDGSTESANESDFIVSNQKLTAGATSVTVTWKRGGTELPLAIPVTVVSAANYNDGYIIALKPEGTTYIEEGQLTSTAKPRVRATYESGNRLLLTENQYTVVGNTERATYTKKCVLSLYLKDNPAIFTKTAAIVRSALEAEDANLTNAQTAEVEEYEVSGSTFTKTGDIEVVYPVKNSTISFALSSNALSKPDLYVRVAMKEAGSVKLADVMTMTVNGRSVFIPGSAVVTAPQGAAGKLVFADIRLPSAVLNVGETNLVVFSFIDDAAGKLAIDRFTLEAGYTGQFYMSTEEYFVANSQSGQSAEFVNTIVKSWGSVADKPYGHAICSDGTYLYITATSYSQDLRALRVQKYDPLTNTQVAQSADTEIAAKEECAGITYYDGKIIVYFMDGRRMYVDVNNFTDGCVFQQYDGFAFEGLESATLKDVYYNPSNQKFAVFSGSNIFIYDKEMKKITNFGVPNDTTGAGARRMIGSAEYIYVSYTKDGIFTPIVHIFDWSGEYVGRMVVPITSTFLTSNGVGDLSRTNVQGMAVINGDFFAILLKFGSANGGDSSAYVKITMPPISEELVPDLSFNEYINACDDASITPQFNAYATYGARGLVTGTSGYAMGGVSDGTYLYVANNQSGNSVTVISKVDPVTFEVIEKSQPFNVNSAVASGDNSRLFIKDGVLYCVAGDVFSIELSKFAQNCIITKDTEMTNLLSMGFKVLKSVYWDDAQRKYAVIDNSGNFMILNEEGEMVSNEVGLELSGFKTSAVCGDQNYIYVSYAKNQQDRLPIDVFDWQGNKVATLSVTGINLGMYDATNYYVYNIQTIYYHNGTLHASVCTWSSGSSNLTVGYYDWTIDVDMTVFYQD